MMLKDFIKEGTVKRITPDKQLAKSLVKIAKKRIKNIEKMKITDDNSFFVIENCYEAIREVSDGLMALKGFKSYSHEANIHFLGEYYPFQIPISKRKQIDKYRKIGNDIKYRGLITTREEAVEAFRRMNIVAKSLFKITEKEKIF